VTVPDIVRGIDEVVTRHTQSKRGTIRTSERDVPVLHTPVEASGKPSRTTKKRGKQPHIPSDTIEELVNATPMIDSLQTEPHMDGNDYDIPEPADDEGQQHTTVCIWSISSDIHAEWA
jgi:hypothetical protein